MSRRLGSADIYTHVQNIYILHYISFTRITFPNIEFWPAVLRHLSLLVVASSKPETTNDRWFTLDIQPVSRSNTYRHSVHVDWYLAQKTQTNIIFEYFLEFVDVECMLDIVFMDEWSNSKNSWKNAQHYRPPIVKSFFSSLPGQCWGHWKHGYLICINMMLDFFFYVYCLFLLRICLFMLA